MTGTISDLVIEGLAATAEALGSDPELLQTPVDHHERAVLVVACPDLIAVKVDTRGDFAAAERRALQEFSVVVPEIADGAQVHITGLSWIAGDPLDQLRGDESMLIERWRDAGALLARIHDHPVADRDDWPVHISHPTRRNEWVDAVVAGGDGLFTAPAATQLELQLEQLLSRIEGALPGLSPGTDESTLVHGDASPQHVLGSAAMLRGLIDLGDAGVGDPVYDVATLTLWFPERTTDVAGGLAAHDGFADRLRFHRLMRFAGGACWLRDHDFDPAPHLEGLYAELLD